MDLTVNGQRLGAVVLTGGTAVRLDGADKAGLEIGGRTLLEHALGALGDLAEVVVVGEEVPTSRPVTFRREDPPGGGPLAGVLAGLEGFVRTPAWVLVLAVDMPLVDADTVARLCRDAGPEGGVLVDEHGARQYLCAVYDVARLREAAPAQAHGSSIRSVVERLDLADVPAVGAEARDVDTWDDVLELRETLAGRTESTQD